jgi:hypothetical protein
VTGGELEVADPPGLLDIADALSDAVGAAFLALTREGEERRSHPYALSMSGLGGCLRKAAYAAALVEPSDWPDSDEARQANLGSLIHERLLPLIAAALPGGARVEEDVVLHAHGIEIPGRYDLYWPGAGGVLVDMKTARESVIRGRRRAGTRDDHRWQVAGYALALRQAGYPVAWLAWCYLDRASGEVMVIVEPFTPELAVAVVDRVVEICRWAYDADAIDLTPRGERGPGLSWVCDGCLWLRRCWGPDARPGRKGAQRVHERPAVESALLLYDELRAKIGELEKQKDFAAAMVRGNPKGRYGSMQLGYRRAGEKLDQKAAVQLLSTAGLPVPYRKGEPSLDVRPASPATLEGGRPAGG